MQTSSKVTKLSLLLLAIAGGGYFALFSSLDLPFNLQNYLILVPVQLGTAAYFLWFRPSKRKLPTDWPE
jgi:hypothetical protein